MNWRTIAGISVAVCVVVVFVVTGMRAAEPQQDCCFRAGLYEKAIIRHLNLNAGMAAQKKAGGSCGSELEDVLRVGGKTCSWSGSTFNCK